MNPSIAPANAITEINAASILPISARRFLMSTDMRAPQPLHKNSLVHPSRNLTRRRHAGHRMGDTQESLLGVGSLSRMCCCDPIR